MEAGFSSQLYPILGEFLNLRGENFFNQSPSQYGWLVNRLYSDIAEELIGNLNIDGYYYSHLIILMCDPWCRVYNAVFIWTFKRPYSQSLKQLTHEWYKCNQSILKICLYTEQYQSWLGGDIHKWPYKGDKQWQKQVYDNQKLFQ